MGTSLFRKDAKSVLLWSALLAFLGTLLGFWLSHPWRVAPAAVGALACPVAYISFSILMVRMRKRKSRFAVTESVYGQDTALMNWMALIFFLLLAFMGVFFAFVFNLLHVFNVK